MATRLRAVALRRCEACLMLTGGCLCGAIRYTVSVPLREVYFCHCAQCRRAQGSAFAASVPAPRAAFKLLQGEAQLKSYRSSPHKRRWFCGECGAPLYSEVDEAPLLRLRAGSLDDSSPLTPVAHIFAEARPAWDAILDQLPRYPGREPGREGR